MKMKKIDQAVLEELPPHYWHNVDLSYYDLPTIEQVKITMKHIWNEKEKREVDILIATLKGQIPGSLHISMLTNLILKNMTDDQLHNLARYLMDIEDIERSQFIARLNEPEFCLLYIRERLSALRDNLIREHGMKAGTEKFHAQIEDGKRKKQR